MEVQTKSVIIISDIIKHNTESMYAFQQKLIQRFKEELQNSKKLNIYQMAQQNSIKTNIIAKIFAAIKKILVLMMSGNFFPLVMRKDRVTLWVVQLKE